MAVFDEVPSLPTFTDSVSCVLYRGDIEGSGHLVDISLTGCVVESEVHVKNGTFLQLEVNLCNQEPPLVIALAPVRGTKGPRLGVGFIGIDAEPQKRIRQFVSNPTSMRTPSSRPHKAKTALQK